MKVLTRKGSFPWLAGGASIILHMLLGWCVVQEMHQTDTSYAGQAFARAPLFASLAHAEAGHAEPVLPIVPSPDPVPPQVNTLAIPVPEQKMPSSPGLDASSASEQKGPAGDGTDAQARLADPFGDYLPAATLDIIPMPVTAPDSSYLNGMHLDVVGQVTVKLYVDAKGKVQKVVIDVPQSQQEAADPIISMFRNTAFVPGRLHGKAVSSVLTIQIRVSDLISVRRLN